MSAYPGNASLATAVKDRVVATFDQTLALYRQGRTDEVVAGCNLILQMDPLFDPARKLLDKARDPSSPVDVSRLMPSGDDPLAEARRAMQARDFERVVQITTEVLTNDLMNDEARVLSDEARERMEAAPFVEQFVKKCQQHITNGNLPAARVDLEKARGLDPNHPGVREIETMIRKADSAPSPFDSSSFVVDTPSASPRSAAQASDFGFTFEEEKAGSTGFENFSFDAGAPAAAPPADAVPPAAFSFDSPIETPAAPGFSFDAPSPAQPASSFDFSTASIETTPDDQKKIDQYLTDGDRAFQAADYQQAIDLWSRIFLIDVTNEAASERIEKAKIKRREIEQKMEGVLAAGIQAYERKDLTTARARFEEVLHADPGNIQAHDYLERLSESSGALSPPPPSLGDGLDTSVDDGFDSPFDRPAPAAAGAAPAPPKVTPRVITDGERSKRSPMLLIGAIVFLLVAGLAGWYFWTRSSEPEQTAADTASLVSRARARGQQGQYDEAIALLREVKPGDGQYETALAMIAELQQKKATAGSMIEGKPLDVFYDESIAAGRAAFAANDYVGAKRAFDHALRVRPLPPDLNAAYDTASQQVSKLEAARGLFNERKYAEAIRGLEALRAQDPTNRNVQRMIIDAHFNIGARALQEDRLPDAIAAFDAVLAEDPNDELAKRSKELAQRYQGQSRDLLYRIYVKYLPLRSAAG